jgi:hypothetical protein
MTKLIRQYNLVSSTYSVEHPTIGKEYLVSITEKEDNGKIVYLSISLDGEEVADEFEREKVMQKIKDYNNQK